MKSFLVAAFALLGACQNLAPPEEVSSVRQALGPSKSGTRIQIRQDVSTYSSVDGMVWNNYPGVPRYFDMLTNHECTLANRTDALGKPFFRCEPVADFNQITWSRWLGYLSSNCTTDTVAMVELPPSVTSAAAKGTYFNDASNPVNNYLVGDELIPLPGHLYWINSGKCEETHYPFPRVFRISYVMPGPIVSIAKTTEILP